MKSKMLTVRLDDDESQMVDELRNDHYVNIAKYVRHKIREFSKELHRGGGNETTSHTNAQPR